MPLISSIPSAAFDVETRGRLEALLGASGPTISKRFQLCAEEQTSRDEILILKEQFAKMGLWVVLGACIFEFVGDFDVPKGEYDTR